MEALLDSGTSNGVINVTTLSLLLKLGRKYVTASMTVFDTRHGTIPINGTAVTHFFSTYLKPDTITTHQFEVFQSSSNYMVIGRDIMNSLGLI